MSAARRNLPSLAIRRPIGTLALASVVVVVGLFSLSRLPLDLLPQIIYPQVRANVNYPGVAPEVMEEQVTRILETALAPTENVIRLESETSEGRAAVNLHFRYGTDVNFALQDASKNLDRARAQLPRDIDPPTIFKFDPSQIPVFEAGFSSSARSLVDLRNWVDLRLRPQLLTIEGVASVDIAGGLVREIHVTLDQERLGSYGLTVSGVLATLRDENLDVAAGNVSSPEFEIIGKTEGKFRTVDDIRAVLLPVPGIQRRIPLSEIATIEDTHRDQRIFSRLDGVPAVKIAVRKQPDANTVRVAGELGRRLEQLAEARFIPDDIEYQIIADQSFFIRNSVAGVRNAALVGASLAMIIVLLFLGSLRKTFIIGLAIPIAVLAAFLMMGLGNLTLNIMSLGGLALGVGMLVDNSIVMLENIFRHRARGTKDPEEAAHAGSAEVTSAVIASTMTSLAAVVPFLLITGLAALIFKELVLTIAFAIAASLGAALTLVPMLAAQLAKVRFESGLDRSLPIRLMGRGIENLTGWYRSVAERAVKRRAIVVTAAFALLGGVWFLTRGLPDEFLPAVDDGNLSVNIRMPAGTSPERTNDLTLEMEELVRTMPYVRHIFATAGGFMWGASTVQRTGRGSVDVILVPRRQRPDMPAGVWVAALQEKIDSVGVPGARIFVRPPRIRGLRTSAAGSDVAISIQGDDLAELQRISEEVIARIRGIHGLEAVQPSAEEASPQLSIVVERERAAQLGLNVAMVGQTVRTALDGAVPTRFTDGAYEYDIRVRLPREQFQSAEALGNIALFPGRDRPVYLRDVATVSLQSGPTSILRENQNRQLRITGDVNDALSNVGTVNREIRARLGDLDLPDNYALIYGGEEEAIKENQRNLAIVIALAVFLVFVVMAVQYESLANPLVILFSIPLSLVGVGLILWLTGTPLSAPVMLGVVLLAGIVVNNAIVLVEYIEIVRREQNLSREAAVVEAGVLRLRPVLMTTLTTVLGMSPLALGIGEGGELMRPLAITVVGGLSLSAVLTLLVVPSVYLIVTGAAERIQRFLVGGVPELGQEPETSAEAPVPAVARNRLADA